MEDCEYVRWPEIQTQCGPPNARFIERFGRLGGFQMLCMQIRRLSEQQKADFELVEQQDENGSESGLYLFILNL